MIELITFLLRAGVDEQAFLDADRDVQQRFAYQQPGLVRRTTARGDGGRWLVMQLWSGEADADRAADAARSSPVAERLAAMIDETTLSRQRFVALD